MNQKVKYYTLLLITLTLVMVYLFDARRIKSKVRKVQVSIKEIDSKLVSGSTVLTEMNQVRDDLLDNKEVLGSIKVSGDQLMNELSHLKGLADEMGIDINDIEIDPRNTFPVFEKNNMSDQIQLERQSVNFTLSGNFIEIGKFIDEVQNNHSMFQIQYCSIGLDSLDPNGVIAQMGYLTYGGPDL